MSVECPTCNREFEYTNVMKSHHTRTHGESISGKTLTCGSCGEDFNKEVNNIKGDTHFCSDECLSSWMSQRYRGNNNPNWKGGDKVEYGSNWYEARRKALSRADYQCELCGMGREEHYSRFDFDLEVHHRIRVLAFDDPEDANYQSNLVVSCRPCHRSKLEADPVPHNQLRAP